MLRIRQYLPVSLVPEPTNPRDSKALAFVCMIDGKQHTIGYVIIELLDEVHAARNVGSIVSVKFSWIRYVTEWSRPGFFAGIDIEKNGMWSTNVVSRQSTK